MNKLEKRKLLQEYQVKQMEKFEVGATTIMINE